jgi:hypothetical protein
MLLSVVCRGLSQLSAGGRPLESDGAWHPRDGSELPLPARRPSCCLPTHVPFHGLQERFSNAVALLVGERGAGRGA